jgi:hypothetical protein
MSFENPTPNTNVIQRVEQTIAGTGVGHFVDLYTTTAACKIAVSVVPYNTFTTANDLQVFVTWPDGTNYDYTYWVGAPSTTAANSTLTLDSESWMMLANTTTLNNVDDGIRQFGRLALFPAGCTIQMRVAASAAAVEKCFVMTTVVGPGVVSYDKIY